MSFTDLNHLFISAAIKVNCNGFCGVSTKSNDTEWAVEEQYFNSTISVADTGKIKFNEKDSLSYLKT